MKRLLLALISFISLNASASTEFQNSIGKIKTLLNSSQLSQHIDAQIIDISLKQSDGKGGTEYFVTIADAEPLDEAKGYWRPATCRLAVYVVPAVDRFASSEFEVAEVDLAGCKLAKTEVAQPNFFSSSAEQIKLALASEDLTRVNSKFEINGISLSEQSPNGRTVYSIYSAAGILSQVTVQN